jgi:hypothetical protein
LAFPLLFAFLTGTLVADEGMWDYTNLPRKQLKEKYGFEATEQWTDHLMKASVRFNSGGSGSFISSTGLVLTNHHVGADTLHKISTPQHDYYTEGYYARTQAEERPAHDLELNQLVSIEDVTARVEAAVKPGMTAEQATLARRAVMARIEKESFDKTGLRSDVVTLYQGGRYHLYRYKRYTDVRLVFAPEFGVAFFGGDPDNFEFPRYDLDMCIFRVYENGKPAKIEHFLKWSPNGSAENDLIFVSGNPGRTSRMFTTEALKFLRDVQVPWTLTLLRRREISLQLYASQGATQDMHAHSELFGVQNSRKVYLGALKGLQDRKLIAGKQREEYALRAKVQGDAALKGYAGAWATVDGTWPIYRKLLKGYSLLEGANAFNSRLFGIARTLVRLAAEDRKPNDQRLPEFRDSARPSLLQALYSAAPVYPELEKAKLADSLAFLAEQLGRDNPLVKAVLQGNSPADRAGELVGGSLLADPGVRKFIAQGGETAITESYDPLIELAVLVDPMARELRKQYEEKVQEPQREGYAQIARALFEVKGTATYPDATFTLRLSFGQVKGYREGDRIIPPFTTLGGAFQYEAAHGAKDPWKLPACWHQAKAGLKGDTHFNFVSTADIIGGNSGSPVVNRQGELVGLIFDGNSHSLTADYQYDDEKSRAVAVDSSGMMEAMRTIYTADTLADEIGK